MDLFRRGTDAPDNDLVQMPTTRIDTTVTNQAIAELLGRLEDLDHGTDKLYPWADRFVMGYPLPDFQRPPRWSTDQRIRFISSIWAGLSLGTYMVNDCYQYEEKEGSLPTLRKFSDVLLDGQQRLYAIECYVRNKIAVPDAHGTPRYWKELGRQERRRFAATTFAKASVRTWDEQELKLVYDLHNYAGVAHTEDERAMK